MEFKRITVNPYQMGGVPCIRNLRIPVATLLAELSQNFSVEDILKTHPGLEKEDIREALLFASGVVMQREFPLIKVA